MNQQKYKALDLFAGVGGVCYGFEQAGFEVVLANDFDEKACKTYQANHHHPILHRDIREIKGSDIPDVNVVLFGFPCQAFSIEGHQKGFEDDRGTLFFEALRLIKEKKPSVIFLENVKNLVSHDKGRTFDIIQEELKKAGYFFKYKILNTYQYGDLPQNRERIYLVGFLDEKQCERFQFPKPIPLTKSMKDITKPYEKKPDKYYYTSSYPNFELLKAAVTDKNAVYQIRRQKTFRKNTKNICPTLTASMGTGGHNVPVILDDFGIRKLTPRECFLLQGFPENFIFPKTMSDTSLYKQAGNSVSVPVINRIATEIRHSFQG